MLKFTWLDNKSILLRTWVSLLPLFIFYKISRLTFFPNFHPLIWVREDWGTWATTIYVLSALSGLVLVWTRRGLLPGMIIIAGCFLYLKALNYGFFWGWASMITVMMFFRYGTLYLKDKWQRFSHFGFFFYFALIYWIPNIDRLGCPEWFNGRIVTTFLSMPFFARWPVIIPPEYQLWLAPLGIGTMLIEVIAPFLLLFNLVDRKKLSTVMIAFHCSLMLISDVELWQPFMVLLWADMRNMNFEFSLRPRLAIVTLLVMCFPFTLVSPPQLHPLAENTVTRALTTSGIFVFKNLHLFSSPGLPVYHSYKLTYQDASGVRDVPAGLEPYTMRFFLGFYQPRPFKPLSVLCQDKHQKLVLQMEARTDLAAWIRKTAEADCSKDEGVLVIDRQPKAGLPTISQREIIGDSR